MSATRWIVTVAGCGVAVLAALPAAGADGGPLETTLRSLDDTYAWDGEVTLGAAPAPEVCAVPGACGEVTVHVDLPAGTWDAGSPSDDGGLLASIDWPSIDVGWDLDLYVYAPDGTLVDGSTSTGFSESEAVWVPEPANGAYRVVVAPKDVAGQPLVDGPLTTLRYDGFVELELGATHTRTEELAAQPYVRQFVQFDDPAAGTALTPDLVPTTPDGFHIESTVGAQFYFFADRGLRHQPSCYAPETLGVNEDHVDDGGLGRGPTKCLRWDQGETNIGLGPLELHVYDGEDTDVWQRTYHTDGSITEARAGSVRFSQTHGHFHYDGFQEIGLYRVDPGGLLTRVASPPDKGICMVDLRNEHHGRADLPTSPLAYGVTGTCDAATHTDPHAPNGHAGVPYLQMGISVGWSDVYPWFIADQYLDISDVPDGDYLLRVDLNLDREIVELDYANNRAEACVRIEGVQATSCSLAALGR